MPHTHPAHLRHRHRGCDLVNNPTIDDSIEFLPGETLLNRANLNNQHLARVIEGQGRAV